jgi:glycosyltransferase involved in cell wall biosynthesis
LIANSKYTKKRIEKYYSRRSEVVYPPAVSLKHKNIETLKQGSDRGYFLAVSRLAAYKKIDVVVKAFNKIGLPLVVIGEGEQSSYLKKIAAKNVKILGWKNDKDLEKYYQGSRAFIFPTVDDFGITMIESMSHGKPVLAIRKGGAIEIVKEGISGEFFDAQTPEVISDCVRRFMEKEGQYDSEIIKESSKKFTKKKFKERIMEIVERSV